MLHERIRRTIDEKKNNLDQRKISKIAGATESSLSRFLNGMEELNFASVMKVVQHLYPEEEKEIMGEYALTQKSRNARFALEYCELNNLLVCVNQLIEKLSASANPVDKEWAKLYSFFELYKHRATNKISMGEVIYQLELFDPKEVEMKVMKQILKAYIYVVLEDFSSLINNTQNIENLIMQVKSNFLVSSFNVRHGLIMNYICLLSNDVESSRYYSYLVLKQDYYENVKALAFNALGDSFMLEDYEKASHYFTESKYLNEKFNQSYNLNIAERNLSFLQSYWKIEREFTLPLDSHFNKANYTYYLIQKGDIELAKKYLDEVDVKSIPSISRAYFYYYCGLIDQKRATFYHSVKWFQLSRDLFHIKLPLDELLKLGEDKDILAVWSK